MLGLILIYFLGKGFYDLAVRNEENGWGYAIFGVVTYYAGTFIAGVLIFIFLDMMSQGAINEDNELAVSLFSIPFGLLVAGLLYNYLKKRFRKRREGNSRNGDSEFLDQDFFK